MPTSIPFHWPENDIKVNVKPRGLQKIPLFKYLSGTFVRLSASFENTSENSKSISCNCNLFRLTGTKEPADFIKQVQDSYSGQGKCLANLFLGKIPCPS